jgi:hypothetical protein
MTCYLCNSSHFITRKGEVRDAPGMQILQCDNCGLVSLGTTEHIGPGFYENSGMRGAEPTPMEAWLKDYQRYPLSNHLHWLSQGKPGGQHPWTFLDTPEMASAYANTLATLGKTDTLIAHLKRAD